jgi:beta-N-acetylhexosaminidase
MATAAVRRRQLSVLAAAALAFAAGAALGAPGSDEARPPRRAAAPPARAAVRRVPLERQVGELVVLRFDGTTAPSYVTAILRRGWAAGAILFGDNIASPAQLRALTARLRAASAQTPILAVDQEGGTVRALPWAPPVAAAAAQRPGPDARAGARALRAAGLNVALAPVADLAEGPALAARSFGADPRRVSAAVAAAVRGWRAGGVAPTVKHFPGLGHATVNTDDGPVTLAAPTAADLAPFRAAVRAGVPLVMSDHARYPALDGAHIASQSAPILEGLLRRRLGFRGVVVTDSMEAAAVRATGSLEQAAVRAIAAGNDVVLTTGRGSWIRVYRALLARARADRGFRARVQESAARVLALRRTLR